MQSRSTFLTRLLLLLALIVSPVVFVLWQYGGPLVGNAQSGSQYFPQTQHSVASPFYEFFAANGGTAIFGYPITEKQADPATGLAVQYFQRARMEYDPATGVHLARLVLDMGYAQPPLSGSAVPLDTPYQHFFSDTGHSSSYAFLAYWQKRGGERIFGYPISEPSVINGRMTQYFERAIMEWWPERAGDARVELLRVGEIYAQRVRIPDDWTRPVIAGTGRNGAAAAPVVTQLSVLATVKEPITRQSGTQTVYALVTNQTGGPVEGANVAMVVHSPMSTHNYANIPTSKNGIAALTFPVEPDRPGQTVSVDINVNYGGLRQTTQTGYMMWWGSR